MAWMRYQPQGRVQVNWGNPITRGLVFATTPSATRSALQLSTPYGIAAARPVLIPEFGTKSGFTTAMPEMTIMGVAMRNGISNSNTGMYLCRLRGAGNANGTAFGIGTEPYLGNNVFSISIQYGDYTGTGLSAPAIENANNQQIVGIGTHSVSALQMNLWLNGRLAVSGAAKSTSLFTGSVVAFMGDAGGGADNTGIPNLMCAMWTRTLSPAEIQSLSQNPWQLFVSVTQEDEEFVQSIAAAVRAALYMNGQGYVMQSPGGMNIKPLVLLNGQVRQRIASEGLPIVFDQGRFRTLAAGETLLL